MSFVEKLLPDLTDLATYKNRKARALPGSRKALESGVTGNHQSTSRGQGLEFDAVREYVPGDDIRNIDWRVTARTGAPHLKLFKQEKERSVVITIDVNEAMRFGTRKTFKSIQAARIAAFIGWQGLSGQDRISGCLFGDVANKIRHFKPTRTRKSFSLMLKCLSEPAEENHFVPLSEVFMELSRTIKTRAMVYVISDFIDFDSTVYEQIRQSQLHKKCDLIFISINDPTDKEMPPLGTIGFWGSLRDKIFVNTASLKGQEIYQSQWLENRRHLHETCTKLQIPLLELSTDSDLHRELVMGLKKISKRKKR